jgi:hypothetical protein
LNLRDLLNSLARRWYVVLAGLLLTGGIAAGLYSVVPVSYISQASVVLLPPKSASDPQANPFLRLGGLSQAVDILTRTINSDAYSEPLVAENRGAIFTTAADTSTSGPIILIESRAPTPARATAMTEAVLAAVPDVLDQIQAKLSVSADFKIDVTTIAVDQKPKLDAKTRLQVVVGVAALGVVLSVLLTGLIDGLALSRRRRIAEESAREGAIDGLGLRSAAKRPMDPRETARSEGDLAAQRQAKRRQSSRPRRPRAPTPSEE